MVATISEIMAVYAPPKDLTNGGKNQEKLGLLSSLAARWSKLSRLKGWPDHTASGGKVLGEGPRRELRRLNSHHPTNSGQNRMAFRMSVDNHATLSPLGISKSLEESAPRR